MDVVDVSRWQFGITTVYHFIFVPLTIGLAPMVATMQTFWHVTKKPAWYRATRFFGTVLLVNFAMGVATGIVQEFQFGMNWSDYSRMVGDVFGGPLALEGLVAFFLESTFLGLWIFGAGKIPAWLHTASIWIVAVAVNLSAYFIIVANSFMQHPVGAAYNPDTGRAELTDIIALLTNPTALAAFPHAVAGSLLTAGTFVLGITGWWMVRDHRARLALQKSGELPAAGVPVGTDSDADAANRHDAHRPAHRLAWWTTLLSAVGLFITGDIQAKLMFVQQPMKMASAESLCSTETDPMFSILTVGTHNNCENVTHLIELPWVLPFLAEGRFSGVTLQGVEDLQQQAELMYGAGSYSPNLFVTYWAFRAMIGLMAGSGILLAASWWFTRKGRVPSGRAGTWFSWICLLAIPTPFLANSAGWIFTEMGRQPWVVHPNPDSVGDPRTEMIRMTVDMGVSDHAPWTVIVTLVGFTLLYAVLAVIWFWLIRRVVLAGPPQETGPDPAATVGARFGLTGKDATGTGDSGSTDDYPGPVHFSTTGATGCTASTTADTTGKES